MLNQKLTGQQAANKTYIEDVFSTYLYTGNGSTQTINNGIDLAGKGGMVWIKGRSGVTDNALYDTTRGATYDLVSNTTAAQTTQSTGLTSFGSTGFSIGALAKLNTSAETYASWTFRKAPKFFDVVTWTGNGNASIGKTITHALGVSPGMIIAKSTSSSSNWACYHRGATDSLIFNSTAAQGSGGIYITSVTSTSFKVIDVTGDPDSLNANGLTYVAYLFAHDTTTDGLIQCGSYTGNGSSTAGPTINLGWEPQYVMIKSATSATQWTITDNMRGWPVSASYAQLYAESAAAELTGSITQSNPTATGFQIASTGSNLNYTGQTYIYMAIRRGPMRTPTDATKVFAPVIWSGDGTNYRSIQSGFATDTFLYEPRNKSGSQAYGSVWFDRLRGGVNYLISGGTRSTNAEGNYATYTQLDTSNGWKTGNNAAAGDINSSGTNLIGWFFRRSPGFFDVVCYTGTGVATTVTHNLGVAPELMIVKGRSQTDGGGYWNVYSKHTGNTNVMLLQDGTASGAWDIWNNTSPTSSVFSINSYGAINSVNQTYVAYLFASCPGVSKAGTYTGNGSSQTINCGFSAGARFVLIKRTDSTGDWYVWDTARGIVSANDPHISLNTTAAEVTTDDTIDPDSTGFIVNQVTATNVNVNAATYIYLAIA